MNTVQEWRDALRRSKPTDLIRLCAPVRVRKHLDNLIAAGHGNDAVKLRVEDGSRKGEITFVLRKIDD